MTITTVIPAQPVYTGDVALRSKPDTFDVDAENQLTFLATSQTPVNDQATAMNSVATEMNAVSVAVNNSSDVALSSANYAGEWSTLTGALAKPKSVSHNDSFYMLLNDLADVTLSEPTGISTDWKISYSELAGIARGLNAPNSSVKYTTYTGVLDAVKYLYDSTAQVTWGVPALDSTGETIVSVVNGVLTTTGGTGGNTYQLTNLTNPDVESVEALSKLSLPVGTIIKTAAFYGGWAGQVKEPSGGGTYTVSNTATVDGIANILLANGNVASLNTLNGVNIDQLGAVGDARLPDGTINPSPTNDYAAIQFAISYAIKNGRNKVTASGSKSYKVDSATSIIIPTVNEAPLPISNLPIDGRIVIDFNGCEFIGSDTANQYLFESGYYDAQGDLQSNFGQPDEKYLTSGYELTNFSGRGFKSLAKLKNWIFGCSFHNATADDSHQVIYSFRSFQLQTFNLIHRGAFTVGLPIFEFEDNTNIPMLQSLSTGNCDIGYQFTGVTESVVMRECGIENFLTVGIKIVAGAGDPVALTLSGGYIESPQGVGIEASNANAITVDSVLCRGAIHVFGYLSGSTTVNITPSSTLNGGAQWFRQSPESSVLGMNTLTPILQASETALVLDVSTPLPISMQQEITAYNNTVGFASVVGRYRHTNMYHPQKVTGRMSNGFGANTMIGTVPTTNTNQAIYTTSIDYTDTHYVHVHILVQHGAEFWTWVGDIYGVFVVQSVQNDTTIGNPDRGLPTVANVGGKLVITTPALGAGITPQGGEIRII